MRLMLLARSEIWYAVDHLLFCTTQVMLLLVHSQLSYPPRSSSVRGQGTRLLGVGNQRLLPFLPSQQRAPQNTQNRI